MPDCLQLEVKVCDQPVTRIHHVPACHYDGDDIGLEYLNSVITKVEPERAASSAGIRTGESILEVCVAIPLYLSHMCKLCVRAASVGLLVWHVGPRFRVNMLPSHGLNITNIYARRGVVVQTG